VNGDEHDATEPEHSHGAARPDHRADYPPTLAEFEALNEPDQRVGPPDAWEDPSESKRRVERGFRGATGTWRGVLMHMAVVAPLVAIMGATFGLSLIPAGLFILVAVWRTPSDERPLAVFGDGCMAFVFSLLGFLLVVWLFS
jgi:hypothetical protein